SICLCFIFHTFSCSCFLFFFNDTATPEIYTLSLHDALPICLFIWLGIATPGAAPGLFAANHSPRFRIDESGLKLGVRALSRLTVDRKSTRLNSSHDQISYAVFCLKKKKK